jgi:flavin reductase (DIM6/NTAB) family NADH-FMN oxidoreductase RutF
MSEDGLLLVTQGADGIPNVMTIGWGTIGSIWGRPIFTTYVRPSRYTYERLEEQSDFTINVAGNDLKEALSHCGTVSGRDHDKLRDLSLTAVPSKEVRPPIIQECLIHYECRTVERNDIDPDTLAQSIRDNMYAGGEFHRVYYGEIVSAYAEEDAANRLAL